MRDKLLKKQSFSRMWRVIAQDIHLHADAERSIDGVNLGLACKRGATRISLRLRLRYGRVAPRSLRRSQLRNPGSMRLERFELLERLEL